MQRLSGFKRTALTGALALAAAVAPLGAAQAQIPGLLPSIEEVVPLGPLPIDGAWRVVEIDEVIIIGDGHAYALDGWLHALIFQIMPGQVVIKDLYETMDGTFVGDDLPLMAQVELTPMPDGSLQARTRGLLPAIYTLVPVYDAPIGIDPIRPPTLPEAPGGGGESWFPPEDNGG